MMKWTLAFAMAIAVVGLGVHTMDVATAGNYNNQTVDYYSVSLTNGQYFSCSDSERTILVDDITYCAPRYLPSNTVGAADFFPIDCVPFFFDFGDPFTFPVGSLNASGINFWSWRTQSTRSIDSFVAGFDISLQDADGAGAAFEFDQHNISSYGQCAQFHSLAQQGFQFGASEFSSEPGMLMPVTASGGGLAMTEPTGMSMYHSFAVTSDSRHYQSPHIVQNGRVYAQTTLGNPTVGIVKIKGRTVATSSGPTVSTCISVTQP